MSDTRQAGRVLERLACGAWQRERVPKAAHDIP